MRVTLIRPRNSPGPGIDRKSSSGLFGGKLYPPYGILYLVQACRAAGLDAHVLDRFTDEHYDTPVEAFVDRVLADTPDVVGLSALTNQCVDATAIADAIRRRAPDVRVVFGGVHFASVPADGLAHGDAVFLGECEDTFVEKLREGPAALTGTIQGVSPPDLDAVPWPRKELLDETGWDPDAFPEFPILTARGCPFHCVFCKDGYRGSTFRFHSVGYVVDWLEYMLRTYDRRRFFIMDDIFGYSNERLEEMIVELERRSLSFEFRCFLHANSVKAKKLELMRRVGVRTVQIGIESGNDAVLEAIGKGTTTAKQRRAVELAKRMGFQVTGLYMIGNITETPATVEDTIRFARSLPTDSDWWSFANPFPGTPMAEVAERHGMLTETDHAKWHNRRIVFVPSGLTEGTMKRAMARAQRTVLRKRVQSRLRGLWREVRERDRPSGDPAPPPAAGAGAGA